jgi:hypothetical protein
LEIPVTTMPICKIPFHLSYLLYLSRVSPQLMSLYLKSALNLCRLTGTEPSFLLHPLDLLGGDQAPELAFFPGMDLSSARKLEQFEQTIAMLSQHFELVNMSAHAQAVLARKGINMRPLQAATGDSPWNHHQEDCEMVYDTEGVLACASPTP